MPRLKKNISSVQRRKETSNKYNLKNTFDKIDVFADVIHGTIPEKILYGALTRMGIPFLFLNDIEFNDPSIDFFKKYQADFIIPSVKVIIEVQGAYWHSKPANIEADSYKLAVYESFGYKALAWWDYEIEDNVGLLISSEPLLMSIAQPVDNLYGKTTELPVVARTKIDTSKGIRTMNARKKKPYRMRNQVSRKQVRKVKSSYAP